MIRRRLLFVPLVLGLVSLPLALAAQDSDDKVARGRVIYVPTEEAVVEKMLDLAEVNKETMDVVRSINRMIDLANAEKAKKTIRPLAFKDVFPRLDDVSPAQQKQLADALNTVNQAIAKINADNTRKAPHVTLPEILSGKCEFASPAVVGLLKELQKKSEVVYDLGCGDGRIVCIAAKKYGARGVGVDIDPERIQDCMKNMKKYGLTKEQVEFRQGDALKVKDLNRADVITFYMLPEFMERLEPQVKKLKSGTRLVAHDFPFPNMKPDQIVEFQGPHRQHTLYLWVLP